MFCILLLLGMLCTFAGWCFSRIECNKLRKELNKLKFKASNIVAGVSDAVEERVGSKDYQ